MIKKYLIEVTVDLETQSLGDVEFFLDSNNYDWDLREEYTMHYDMCDKCKQEITDDNDNYYIEEEDLRLCEDCYMEYLKEHKGLE